MPNDFVAHKAAVDISELLVGPRPGGIGRSGKAMHPQGAGTVVHPHRIGHKRLAQHIRQAQCHGLWASVGTPLGQGFSLVPDRKAHIGSRQGMAAHAVHTMGQLGGVGFEEFAPCWGVEKQVLHFDRGAHLARCWDELAGAGLQGHGMALLSRAGGQAEVGHRRNRRQRFTPKTHGRHRFQVLQVADLAGGMALEGHRQLFRGNAASVVFDADQPNPTGAQTHMNLAGTGIECVVQQLAQHRRRSLNDLASSDLTDQFIGKFADGSRQKRGICHRGILRLALQR